MDGDRREELQGKECERNRRGGCSLRFSLQ
jgi:hypothetical protein